MSALAHRLGGAQRRWPVLQLAALVVLFIYGASTITGFSSTQSLRSMLVLASLLGLAATGQTLVVILGGLDLSVPGLIVAGAILVSELCGTHHWPLLAALAFIVVVAGVIGAFAGGLCHRLRVNPLIVTLATGAIAAGGCLVWTGGRITGTAPPSLSKLSAANGTTIGLDVAPIVVIWAVVAVLIGLFLHRRIGGRRLFATGANPRAANLTLIPKGRVWMATFACSAIFSALVGVVLAGFSGADQALGDPYLFQGLTAVIVGGTTLMGARGDYTHTVVGALVLTELTTILVGRGYEAADQQIIFGVLILIVVAGYGRERRLRDRV